MMEKITIKGYAAKHKLSIFDVVKMTKSGQLPTETVQENGKDTLYILLENGVEERVENPTDREESKAPYSLKKENERLKREIRELKEEIARLKNSV